MLPLLNPALREEMPAFGGAWVAAHGVYGFTAGACAQLVRRRARVAAARAAPAAGGLTEARARVAAASLPG